MSQQKVWVVFLLLMPVILIACEPFFPASTPMPGLNTIIALTAQAAASETAAALPPPTFTPTPSLTPRPVTATPTPTETVLFDFLTSTPSTPTFQPPPDAWPGWDTGEVVKMPKGSGENVGTVKYFPRLAYVKVIVIRDNGVKLRLLPSTEAGTNLMAAKGQTLILLGFWNKNSGNSYVKVRTSEGKEYWVGGNGNADPVVSLAFLYVSTETPTSVPWIIVGTPTE
jgi:hypothetical protein